MNSNPADRATAGLSDLTEHERLAREYALLQAEQAPIQARMDEIKKIFRNDLDYGKHDISGLNITIGRNARFDTKRATEMYPADKYPDFYHGLDTAAMKEALPPAVYKALSNEGEPRVTIK